MYIRYRVVECAGMSILRVADLDSCREDLQELWVGKSKYGKNKEVKVSKTFFLFGQNREA